LADFQKVDLSLQTVGSQSAPSRSKLGLLHTLMSITGNNTAPSCEPAANYERRQSLRWEIDRRRRSMNNSQWCLFANRSESIALSSGNYHPSSFFMLSLVRHISFHWSSLSVARLRSAIAQTTIQ